MKRAALVVGREPIHEAQERLVRQGYVYDDEAPEFVVSLGGDGTLLRAEHLFPGTPKLMVRDAAKLEELLGAITAGRFSIRELPKLMVEHRGERYYALNDISLRNKSVAKAIRFTVGDESYIGDGIVVATAYGSTGYFTSITHESFAEGFGLAFNNTTKAVSPRRFQECNLRVRLVRGPAVVGADNLELSWRLEADDEISITGEEARARMIQIPPKS